MKNKQASKKSNIQKEKKENKIEKFLFWAPRLLSILFILFLMLFSLDIFDMNLGFWETLLGLFIHNVPSFILLIILIISWKHEIVGGVAFILAGLFYIIRLLITIIMHQPHEWHQLLWTLPIAAPALLVGVLFLVGWKRKKFKQKMI